MKYPILILLLAAPFALRSQSNNISIRTLWLGTSDLSQVQTLDSIGIVRNVESNSFSANVDIGYKRTNENGGGLVFRFGVRAFSTSSFNRSKINNAELEYIVNQTELESFFYSLSVGGFQEMWTKEKFSITIGAESKFTFKPKSERSSFSQSFNNDMQLLGSSLSRTDIPKMIGAGINFNLNSYYKLLGPLSLGIELVLGLDYQKEKGEIIAANESFDAFGALEESLYLSNQTNKNSFNKSFFTALGLQYSF